MENAGRALIVAGILVLAIGLGLYLSARLGLPLSHLPGDVRVARDGASFHFPIATSLLLSVVLTIAINVILRLLRK